MSNVFFIMGTNNGRNTDVGKTTITAALTTLIKDNVFSVLNHPVNPVNPVKK